MSPEHDRVPVNQPIAHLRTLLQQRPSDLALQWEAAQAFYRERSWDEARQCLHAVLNAQSRHVPALLALGSVEAAAGQWLEAEAVYRRILEDNPGNLQARMHLCAVCLVRENHQEAVTHADIVLAQQPQHVPTLVNLGVAARAVRLYGKSIEALQAAVRFAPDHAVAQAELARAHYLQLTWDQGIVHARLAVTLQPNLALGWRNLAQLASSLGLADEADTAYTRLADLTQDPDIPLQRLAVHPIIPDSAGQLRQWRKRLLAGLQDLLAAGFSCRDPIRADGPLPFYYAYDDDNVREVAEALAGFYRSACPELTFVAEHCQNPDPDRSGPLRVGFVSGFFGGSVVGEMFRETLCHFDPHHVAVTVISVRQGQESWSSFAHTGLPVVEATGTLADMQRTIAACQLDVLVFTDIGMEPTTYFLAFSRLAPVQVVLGGHPATTGLATIDYAVSPGDAEPADAEDHYTETLIRLPNGVYRFEPPPATPATLSRADFRWNDDDLIVTCAQAIFKLHPDFDRIVGTILRQEPRARFVLIASHTHRWTQAWIQRFAEHFPDCVGRIQVFERMAAPVFLQFLTLADAVLDPLYFGGGSTILLAMALGVPIVTWPGRFLRGRVAAALYDRMGMAGPVATNGESYVDLTLRLLHDPDWKAALSREILAKSPALFHRQDAVVELEDFLAAAVEAARKGERLPAWPKGRPRP